jgi:hypothetical protein
VIADCIAHWLGATVGDSSVPIDKWEEASILHDMIYNLQEDLINDFTA